MILYHKLPASHKQFVYKWWQVFIPIYESLLVEAHNAGPYSLYLVLPVRSVNQFEGFMKVFIQGRDKKKKIDLVIIMVMTLDTSLGNFHREISKAGRQRKETASAYFRIILSLQCKCHIISIKLSGNCIKWFSIFSKT